MKYRKIFFSLINVFIVYSVVAQVEISGKIADLDGNPIPNAHIIVAPAGAPNSILAFAQEYQTVDSANMVFNYEYHYLQDSTKLNQKSTELMTLRIGKSYSLFSHPTIIFVDSVFSSSGGADGMVALEKVLPIIQSN